MIESRELTKKFGNVTAVNSVSFDVKEGELFAFLGPNGAGKQPPSRCFQACLSPQAELHLLMASQLSTIL